MLYFPLHFLTQLFPTLPFTFPTLSDSPQKVSNLFIWMKSAAKFSFLKKIMMKIIKQVLGNLRNSLIIQIQNLQNK